MKTLIPTLILVFFASFTHAQKGEITIEQDEKIEELLDIYQSIGNSEYFTIQIGFVSSNQKAYDLESLANIDFPNLSSRVDFDSPTYRVKLGRFKTKLEGERKLQEVRRKYPAAMLLKQKKSS